MKHRKLDVRGSIKQPHKLSKSYYGGNKVIMGNNTKKSKNVDARTSVIKPRKLPDGYLNKNPVKVYNEDASMAATSSGNISATPSAGKAKRRSSLFVEEYPMDEGVVGNSPSPIVQPVPRSSAPVTSPRPAPRPAPTAPVTSPRPVPRPNNTAPLTSIRPAQRSIDITHERDYMTETHGTSKVFIKYSHEINSANENRLKQILHMVKKDKHLTHDEISELQSDIDRRYIYDFGGIPETQYITAVNDILNEKYYQTWQELSRNNSPIRKAIHEGYSPRQFVSIIDSKYSLIRK